MVQSAHPGGFGLGVRVLLPRLPLEAVRRGERDLLLSCMQWSEGISTVVMVTDDTWMHERACLDSQKCRKTLPSSRSMFSWSLPSSSWYCCCLILDTMFSASCGENTVKESVTCAYLWRTYTCYLCTPGTYRHLLPESTCYVHTPVTCEHLLPASTCDVQTPVTYEHLSTDTCYLHLLVTCIYLWCTDTCYLQESVRYIPVTCEHLLPTDTCYLQLPATWIYLWRTYTCYLWTPVTYVYLLRTYTCYL